MAEDRYADWLLRNNKKSTSDKQEYRPHLVLGRSIFPPFPEKVSACLLAMGCFWGAERLFWSLPGVYITAVGYAGGAKQSAYPDYHEVCAGRSGHAEVVLVLYKPEHVNFSALLKAFWEGHDPTQGMRQGNDIGSQYRSALFCFEEKQRLLAVSGKNLYQQQLLSAGHGQITTTIAGATKFYYAEPYHQQHLQNHSDGYCGLGGTGIACLSV